jgi:hypothetical protein
VESGWPDSFALPPETIYFTEDYETHKTKTIFVDS